MEFVLGGAAACGACFFTNPLEVVKTRVQLQGELLRRGKYTVHYRNVFHAFYAIAKADGVLALQKGLAPALCYQLCMNGVRLGTFDTLDKLGFTRNSNGNVSFPRSVAVGAISGCVSSFLGSPFYLVKTHLQAQSSSYIAVGHQHHHQGMMQALKDIYKRHGLTGLWRGVTASMVRTTCGSAPQLATFAKSKSIIDDMKIFGKADSWLNALMASMLSGVVVVAAMTPFDVMSTRLYNQPVDSQGRGIIYSGISDCFLKIFRSEGLFGFYKGWSASLLRLGPHTVLSLLFWSQLRKFYANGFYSTTPGS